MSDETRVISGFYKGVPITIDAGSVSGGRKLAIKQFPSRDTQAVEDLGLLPRKYSLDIVITDKREQDYFNYRNSLLAALDAPGGGTLIHPLYGRIENVVVANWSLNERLNSFGDTTISVNFEIENNTGIPQAVATVVTQVSAANEALQQAVNADIAATFKVSSPANFEAATSKVEGIIAAAESAVSFVGEAADGLDAFSGFIGDFKDNITQYIGDALPDQFTALFDQVSGLYDSAEASFDAFTGFFGFGDSDTALKLDTADRIQRDSNARVLNSAVGAAALGYAYLAASRTDYTTTREIDAVAATLDDQFTAVQTSDAGQTVKDSVTDMRVTVLAVLDQARVNAKQLITVDTKRTSARVLAFSHYGNDDDGQTLVDLNAVTDVSFVEGPVEILTA